METDKVFVLRSSKERVAFIHDRDKSELIILLPTFQNALRRHADILLFICVTVWFRTLDKLTSNSPDALQNS